MRAMLIGLTLATGAALAVPASTPATAEGIHLEGPGVSVGVGAPHYRHYDRDRYYYSERPRVRVYDSYARGSCKTVIVRHDDGRVRKIRRCD